MHREKSCWYIIPSCFSFFLFAPLPLPFGSGLILFIYLHELTSSRVLSLSAEGHVDGAGLDAAGDQALAELGQAYAGVELGAVVTRGVGASGP